STTWSAATCTARTVTTATTTGRPKPPSRDDDEAFEFIGRLTARLLAWSFEGTMRSERIVQDVAAVYGLEVEAAMLADSAVLTHAARTVAFAGAPPVPPPAQVSALKALLLEIGRGGVPAAQASERLAEPQRPPPRWSKAWQVVGLGLFATGFGISVQAT